MGFVKRNGVVRLHWTMWQRLLSFKVKAEDSGGRARAAVAIGEAALEEAGEREVPSEYLILQKIVPN